MINNSQISTIIINVLEKLNVSNACVSPGARNAPMINALSESKIKKVSVLDERSAAFFALGIAKKINLPVILSCTSGTALANMYPAVIEAYMSETPMIIISADRPKKSIDKGENQTIYQKNIYGKYTLYFDEIDSQNDDVDSIITKINNAFHASIGIKNNQVKLSPGPVHINTHFDKPLIDLQVDKYLQYTKIKEIYPADFESELPLKNKLVKKPLIICGQTNLKHEKKLLLNIAKKIEAPIFADISSNIRGNQRIVPFYQQYTDSLSPDLILRFGKKPLSKKLLELIKKNKDITYLIRDKKNFNDDAIVVNQSTSKFSDNINNYIDVDTDFNWLSNFKNEVKLAKEKITSSINNKKINEYSFAHIILNLLPEKSNLFVGNSISIRALDSFCDKSLKKDINIFSNRGASGIDGNISTALGISSITKNNNYLIIGDQSVMHDLGSLQMINELKINLKIFIMNNQGGSIFDLINLKENIDSYHYEKFIKRKHSQNFKNLSKAFNINYSTINSIKELQMVDMMKPEICEVLIDLQDSIDFIRNFK